jgi:hypothetical protein
LQLSSFFFFFFFFEVEIFFFFFMVFFFFLPFFFFFFFFFFPSAKRDVLLKPCPHSVAQLAHACLARYIQRMQITAAQPQRRRGQRCAPSGGEAGAVTVNKLFFFEPRYAGVHWRTHLVAAEPRILAAVFARARFCWGNAIALSFKVALEPTWLDYCAHGGSTLWRAAKLLVPPPAAQPPLWQAARRRGAAKPLLRRAAKPPVSHQTF